MLIHWYKVIWKQCKLQYLSQQMGSYESAHTSYTSPLVKSSSHQEGWLQNLSPAVSIQNLSTFCTYSKIRLRHKNSFSPLQRFILCIVRQLLSPSLVSAHTHALKKYGAMLRPNQWTKRGSQSCRLSRPFWYHMTQIPYQMQHQRSFLLCASCFGCVNKYGNNIRWICIIQEWHSLSDSLSFA